jgi:hypothetical protein
MCILKHQPVIKIQKMAVKWKIRKFSITNKLGRERVESQFIKRGCGK